MIETLRRALRQVRTLAYNRYDLVETGFDAVRQWLVLEVDNRQLRQNPVRLEEDFFFPMAAGWDDEVTVLQQLDLIEWSVAMKGYDAFVAFSVVNIGRPDVVARLERIVPRLPEALQRLKMRQALNIFRTSPITITGQPFFDAAHPRPADKGTYSNILAPAWVAAATPTEAEAMALIDSAKARFVDITTVESELIDASQFAQQMRIITHSTAAWEVFERLRTRERMSDSATESNPYRNTFTLYQDARPATGQETYIEIVHAVPNGPRPVVWVPDTDPELEAWETNRVPNGYVATGFKQQWGMKPYDPSTTLQVQPTTI